MPQTRGEKGRAPPPVQTAPEDLVDFDDLEDTLPPTDEEKAAPKPAKKKATRPKTAKKPAPKISAKAPPPEDTSDSLELEFSGGDALVDDLPSAPPPPAVTTPPPPVATKPGQTNPGTTRPGQTNPGTTRPGQTTPGTSKPSGAPPASAAKSPMLMEAEALELSSGEGNTTGSLLGDERINCPKCGRSQPKSDSCYKCGVLFARAPGARNTADLPSPKARARSSVQPGPEGVADLQVGPRVIALALVAPFRGRTILWIPIFTLLAVVSQFVRGVASSGVVMMIFVALLSPYFGACFVRGANGAFGSDRGGDGTAPWIRALAFLALACALLMFPIHHAIRLGVEAKIINLAGTDTPKSEDLSEDERLARALAGQAPATDRKLLPEPDPLTAGLVFAGLGAAFVLFPFALGLGTRRAPWQVINVPGALVAMIRGGFGSAQVAVVGATFAGLSIIAMTVGYLYASGRGSEGPELVRRALPLAWCGAVMLLAYAYGVQGFLMGRLAATTRAFDE